MNTNNNKSTWLICGLVGISILILHRICIDQFNQHILPLLSVVKNDSWVIQILMLLFVFFSYCWMSLKHNTFSQGIEIFPKRLIWIGLFGGLYLFFRIRYFNDYVCYGLEKLKLCYVDICLLAVGLIEIRFLLSRCYYRRNKENHLETIVKSFFAENPTNNDGLLRRDYAECLVEKIVSSFNDNVAKDSSFTILLNEKYGTGKTSFFLVLKDVLASKSTYLVDFKPWLCSDANQMAIELLEQMMDAGLPINNRIFFKYANALKNSDSLFGMVSKLIILSNSSSLAKQLEYIKQQMQQISKPMIVLVDDVDRLSQLELLELIKLIRNTIAFPNVFYIIAADKQYLSMMLSKLDIPDSDVFLQKFFNMEMNFPKDDTCVRNILHNNLKDLLSAYLEKKPYVLGFDIDDYINDFFAIPNLFLMIQTPRDIYRYCNMLSFELDILQKNDLLYKIEYVDLMQLILLRYLSSDVYKLLRDRDECVLRMGRYLDWQLQLNENYQDLVHKIHGVDVEKIVNGVDQKRQTKCVTLHEAMVHSVPDKEELIVTLLERLFPSTTSSCYSVSMCNKDEYFKYFSGRYACFEMTGAEAYNIIRKPKEEFQLAVANIQRDKKYTCFQRKFISFLSENKIDNINILDNLAYLWSLTRANCGVNKIDVEDLFSLEMYRYMGWTFSWKEYSDTEFHKLQHIFYEWISVNENLDFVALTLLFCREHKNDSIVFNDEMLQNCIEIIINRFLYEKVANYGFESGVVDLYRVFGRLGYSLWYPRLQEYVEKSYDVTPWVYNIIGKKNDVWKWNDRLIEGINSIYGGNLDGYFKRLGIKFEKELQSSMLEVRLDLSVDEQKDNQFVQLVINMHNKANNSKRNL